MGSCVLVLALLTVFVLVLAVRQQRTKRDLPLWLLSGFVGVLLGVAGSAAAVLLTHYDLVRRIPPDPAQLAAEAAAANAETEAHSERMDGMAQGPGGGMGGMMGGGRGGPGGFAPAPKRQLTTLVQKIDLLTGDVALDLTTDQATQICGLLADIETSETMSDEEATAKYDALLAVLSEEQRAKEQAVGLPRRPRRGGGPGMGGMMGGPGSGPSDENPFRSEENAQALTQLRERFGAASPPAEAPEATNTSKGDDADAAP
jgi:hypothetical protein